MRHSLSQANMKLSKHHQQRASDPDYSAWVSASAGTGKTKILTDRVLRLLLDGVNPSKILCLTFTNAASNEMYLRINSKLANWAKKEFDIVKDIEEIQGKIATQDQIKRASKLYLNLLNSPEKINILTIHSFCQKILKNFPFESGLNPRFKILSDIDKANIVNKIKLEILLNENNMAEFLSANFHDTTINKIYNEIIEDKLLFKKLFAKNSSMDFSYYDEEENIKKLSAQILDLEKKTNKKIADFIKKDGSKKVKKDNLELQDQFYELLQELRQNQIIIYSKIFTKMAFKFIELYDDYKKANDIIDYDDLIYLTKELLCSGKDRDWVLYKLDGGIDHLLVDEAQDTSNEQWEIIDSLVKEFYSGETSKTNNRTIFIVGDEKQSIYSFQGANIESFSLMQNQMEGNLSEAKKKFEKVNLEISYRSNPRILELVHNVFLKIKEGQNANLFKSEIPKIESSRHKDHGIIELWELVNTEDDRDLFWDINAYKSDSSSAKLKLAKEIALFIKKQIDEKIIIPSTGLPPNPSDFMILVRNRNDFIHELLNQLSLLSIDASGIDRMELRQALSILDLIALAKFVLSPHDDLNLASLLKSPIIGITEEALYNLCVNRKNESIWELLNASENFLPIKKQLYNFIQLYETTSLSEFFFIIIEVIGFREKLNNANGIDSDDAINELLYIVSDYSSMVNSSLQDFIYWFENNNEIEIKRNIENLNGVRIMTVHGAKGLQSPIVILSCSADKPKDKNTYIWYEDQILASLGSDKNPAFFNEIKEISNQKNIQEYVRLLYVALTRASDHLIICGYGDKKNITATRNSWYDLIAKVKEPVQIILEETLPKNIIEDNMVCANNYSENNLTFDYFFSEKGKNTEQVESIFQASLYKRKMEYGKIFHKILEDSFKAKNLDLMETHPLIQTLEGDVKYKIESNIKNLLSNHEFTDFLTYDVRTEVNIGSYHENIKISRIGRIDLLIIKNDHIIVIDYKSDKNPSSHIGQIPKKYVEQLALYRDILQSLYPKKKVITKILWLENASFMELI